MPRKSRRDVVVPGAPHHVVLRGNNRRSLFSYAPCYAAFVDALGDAARRYGVLVHALLLMLNHVHLVLTPSDVEALAATIKLASQRYAMRRNRLREASGKLFEQRYHCVPITSDAQLAATLPYVELNPCNAGVARDPAEWRWSTYRLHAGEGVCEPPVAEIWTPCSWWLELSTDPALRFARYREHVRDRRASHEALALASLRAAPSVAPYTRRILRPDGSRACEPADVSYTKCTIRSGTRVISRGWKGEE